MTAPFHENWNLLGLDPDEGFLKHAYRSDFKPLEATKVHLPVTAPAALFESGKIPDPYFGRNNLELLWLEKKEWWYFKDFDLDRLDGVWTLDFAGVNERADAWLNGVKLGSWEGSFLEKTFDLPRELCQKKDNRLTVRVRAQERSIQDGGEVTVGTGYHVSPAHIRSQQPVPQYAYGWNWAPHMIAVGLYRPVKLSWHAGARLANTQVRTELSTDLKNGTVFFKGTLLFPTDKSGKASLHLEVEIRKCFPKPEKKAALKIVQKIKGSSFDFKVSLSKPDLWWPNGHGEQHLYTVELRLCEGKKVIDQLEKRVGFRNFHFVRNTRDLENMKTSGQSDRPWSVVGDPYPWTVVVNGKKIFAKGSNWCPSDQLYRENRSRLQRFIRLAAESHQVLLRVWGGGLSESEDFYDLCDEYGLLVFQEFWLACGNYPGMDQNVFLENAAFVIRRLRHRTSLAWWCGGNEFNPNSLENRPLIDALEKLVATLDPDREFRRGSPYKGDRHGGLVYLPRRTSSKYRDLLPGKKRIVLFRSECAVGRSPARPENIERFIPKESLHPISFADYEYHHARRTEWDTVTKPFGKSPDWRRELLHASVLHALDNRMNMEFSRSLKYESSGCLTWQLNGSWPSFHREHIDWYGHPKPVYYFYKNAMKPLIFSADIEKLVWSPGEDFAPRLSAVSDLAEAVKVRGEWKILSPEGKILVEEKRDLKIAADSVAQVEDFSWKIPESFSEKVFFLSLSLWQGTQVVHENFYWIAVSPDQHSPNALILGEGLTLAHLGKKTTVSAPHYYYRVDVNDTLGEKDETSGSQGDARNGSYQKTFSIPTTLRGQALELVLPDLSGDDETYFNGVKIGETRLGDTERNYRSDPLHWPTLPWRIYDLPVETLHPEKNLLEIWIRGDRFENRGDQIFGLPEMPFLRPKTSEAQREIVRRYFRDMGFYRSMTEGRKATVQVRIHQSSPKTFEIEMENPGDVPAVFAVLDLEKSEDTLFHFDEGAFSLPGGAVKKLKLFSETALPQGARLRMIGLNLEETFYDLGKSE